MALKPWTMSFKEKNEDEIKLHEILSKKTSPMAFAKDILIDVLVRGKSKVNDDICNEIIKTEIVKDKESNNSKDNLSELFGLD